ncbi:acyl carrier protein [Agarivorans albus]|uniref:Acyl carrier protein n=1 Tax=Agarivorans albus MKT 106 TaxID=1331007 RepID=R9PTU2_AGAAL|nr:acyl carrier protein [Agarivorans albus]GAD03016.1 hypothetical protein AALB_3096 [Agarivorans albus MKT 106]
MNIELEVKRIIAHHSGLDVAEISVGDIIEDDYGISGDDAWEIIEALQDKFDLNLEELEFPVHFSPEVSWSSHTEYGYYPVRVSHLVQVCESGAWFKPEKSESYYLLSRKARWKNRILYIGLVVLIAAIFGVYFDNCT